MSGAPTQPGGPPPQELSVADIRKALNLIRQRWSAHAPNSPLIPAADLMHGMTTSSFCLHFVLGHHTKRHNKISKQQSQGRQLQLQARQSDS